MNADETYRLVQERYGGLAAADRSTTSTCGKSSKENYEEQVATAFGYKLEDLRSIPEGANLGVSCGNPIATAGLREVCSNIYICSSPLSRPLFYRLERWDVL
jgi:arsenite methyltransferase